MEKLIEILTKHMENRLAAEQEPDRAEKEAKARDAVVEMLGFVQSFLGEDVMRAAYGQVDPANREDLLRVVAARINAASMVFAKMPDDEGSLSHVADEAMAIAKGDAPVFFAQLSDRKRSWRNTMARFQAFAWDAYLEGLGLDDVTRESAITLAFGERSDTRRKWLGPARLLLSDEYVDYHLGKAKVEGLQGAPYSLSQSYYDAKVQARLTWQDALTRDGKRYRDILRAGKIAKK